MGAAAAGGVVEVRTEAHHHPIHSSTPCTDIQRGR